MSINRAEIDRAEVKARQALNTYRDETRGADEMRLHSKQDALLRSILTNALAEYAAETKKLEGKC